jgi:4-amino-4-deoxy-L-arabinose transferase-like glycosyltransferase
VAVTLLGLAIRVAYAVVQRHWPVIGDALTFHIEGRFLADGEGFRRAFEDVPTAEHPPLMSVVLAGLDLLGLDSTAGQKVGLAVIGSATVPLVGLIGRQAAGERAGLVAALLAAAYPMLWAADGSLMSETVYGVFVAASLWCAYRALERPTARRFAVLGALIALAALTRGEAIGLLVLLVAPLAWRVRSWEKGLVALAAFALVIAPWTVRNLTTFEEPVLISTNSYGIWVGANCQETYYGELVGSWVFSCYGKRPKGDEVQESLEYRRRGLDYARDHAGRLPVVLAARAGRLLDVYRPWSQGVFLASAEGRRPAAQRLGLIAWWVLAPLALLGALVLRRRRAPLVVLLAPCLLVLLVALATYGSTRFRFAAEPAIVVLAAVALEEALRRRGRRPAPGAPTPAAPPPA